LPNVLNDTHLLGLSCGEFQGFAAVPLNEARLCGLLAASYVPKAKISDIEVVLSEILEAKEQGKNSWWHWRARFGSYFEKKFASKNDNQLEFLKENHVIRWEMYFH